MIFLVFTAFNSVHADERVLPAATLIKMGFQPFENFRHYRGSVRVQSDLPQNIPWPITFLDAGHTIAQNYVNFQDYGDGGPYYHKGCDLRTQAGSWVKAPVTGVLEGGYYGYSNNPDGSQKKFWKPWNGQTHSDPYFELALVTQDGYRFELHHVNSLNLPQSTIDALNKGGVVIPAGTNIGHVLPWPDGVYNHIHYNIFRQDGVIENPEFHSLQVPDHVPPKIYGVYGLQANGSVIQLNSGGTVSNGIKEIVVATTENRDNDTYVQTPPFIGLHFDSGAQTIWDFRHFLITADGKWPDIREVFLPALRLPNGQRVVTFGQFGKGMFLMRLKVPTSTGHFTIKVGDTAGNFSNFEGTVQ